MSRQQLLERWNVLSLCIADYGRSAVQSPSRWGDQSFHEEWSEQMAILLRELGELVEATRRYLKDL